MNLVYVSVWVCPQLHRQLQNLSQKHVVWLPRPFKTYMHACYVLVTRALIQVLVGRCAKFLLVTL